MMSVLYLWSDRVGDRHQNSFYFNPQCWHLPGGLAAHGIVGHLLPGG